MGTDVHAGVEVNDGEGWKPLYWPNRWYRPDDADEPPQTPRLDIDRNYCAFAILADVRNGAGFAGCDTGDGFVPIAPRRGLPDDAHPDTLEHACTGDHSETYLTADEILSYDWTRLTKRRGWVNGPTFEKWDRIKRWEPRPESWCGMVSGGMVKHVTVEEMRCLVAEIIGDRAHTSQWQAAADEIEQKLGSTYCQLEWEEPYTQAAGDLWTKVVPLVMKLAREHKSVRLVMNFDS